MQHRRNNNRRFRPHSDGRNHHQRSNGGSQSRLSSVSISNGRGRSSNLSLQGAEKLVEKYNLLAKDAQTSGDRSLSENYFQHADHYIRIVEEKNLNQKKNNIQTSETTKLDENKLTEKPSEEKK